MMARHPPTAVNLFWAIDRMKAAFAAAAHAGESPRRLPIVSSAKRVRFTTRTSRTVA
jgi:methylthioribose-1-phosphate isomerase